MKKICPICFKTFSCGYIQHLECCKRRKYYPDFYLSEYDVYLDPKNDWLIQTDSEKIRRCCKQNNIRVFILKENQLEWNKIKNIIQTDGL